MNVKSFDALNNVVKSTDIAGLLKNSLEGEIVSTSNCAIIVDSVVVSKMQGRTQPIDSLTNKRELVLDEATRIVRDRGDTLIVETADGLIVEDGGIREIGNDYVLLPNEPDSTAHGLRLKFKSVSGIDCPFIISATFSTDARIGQTTIALGFSGLVSLVESFDRQIPVADHLATAAELVMSQTGNSLAVVYGLPQSYIGTGRASDLIAKSSQQLFR